MITTPIDISEHQPLCIRRRVGAREFYSVHYTIQAVAGLVLSCMCAGNIDAWTSSARWVLARERIIPRVDHRILVHWRNRPALRNVAKYGCGGLRTPTGITMSVVFHSCIHTIRCDAHTSTAPVLKDECTTQYSIHSFCPTRNPR